MENQRIRLSKKMLRDSFITLLQKKDIKDISIQEICQEAQINRTTFYKYYGSQYDLLDDIEIGIFNDLEACLSNGGAWVSDSISEGLSETLTYFEKEREKCLILINTAAEKEFAEKLFQLPIIQTLLNQTIPPEYTEDQVQYVQAFIMHGGYAMIRKWINSENRESIKEMSMLIQNVMSKLMLK